ncbi:MAG: hypothetical protein J6S53_06365 [Lentisphaeria bacterium]|nr:hypothetical protein [Lentisphaeria bacterium]
MAILNRIVNILILLLVIAAGVFSYMLFDKRESLTKGMKDMAQSISVTARTLDDGGASGTKAANNLKEADLDHKKAFKSVLPELNKTAQLIVNQRNTLAQTIETAGRTLGATGVKSASLRLVDNYEAESKKFKNAVYAYKENTDGVKRAFVDMGNKIGASLKVNELDGEGYKDASKKILTKVNSIRSENSAIVKDMDYIKNKMGVAGNKYSTNTARFWREAVDKRAKEISTITRERANFKSLSERQAKEIERLKKTIEARDKSIEDHKGRIDHLEQVITDDGKKPMPALQLKADSPECYKEVRGSIEYVNEEYGFVQIDIGRNYVIVQEYGVKKNNVPFPLQTGLTMSVLRGSGENAEIIAKILVKTVNADNAICNVIKGKVSDIRVKDRVIFSDEDIAGIPAAKINKK